ncbi:MAG: AI-2E family transporter [Nanoarchaeota archaeon]|nr:AI-2E family transporter [Nanoarchaeota archaeon]
MGENKLVNASIIFIAIVFLVIVLKTFKVFLRPLALAIILTLLLTPLIRLSRRLKVSFGVTMIGIVVILFVFVYLMGLLISIDAVKIDEKLPNYSRQVDNTLHYFTTVTNINVEELNLADFVNTENIIKLVKIGVQATGMFISEIFLAIIFTLFLLPTYKRMVDNFEKGLNKTSKKKLQSTLYRTEESIRKYLGTKSLVSFGTALVSAIVLLLFRADFVLIIALLIFLLNFIPNIGSFIAVFLAVISYLLKFGPASSVLWLAALLILIQVIFGNILEPKLAGAKLNLSPIVIIISLFLWYWVWGIVGMILAIPIISILKIVLEQSDSTKHLAKLMS